MHDYESFKSEDTITTSIGYVWPPAIVVPAGARNCVTEMKKFIISDIERQGIIMFWKRKANDSEFTKPTGVKEQGEHT